MTKREKFIQIRLLPEEKSAWVDAAMQRKISLSDFIRNVVNHAIDLDLSYRPLDKEFIQELITLHIQLTKVLSSRFNDEFIEVERLLQDQEGEYGWDL